MRMLATACALFALLVGTPALAATLITNGDGKLTGATGVDVGGTLYDVSLVEGTCSSLFEGCDASADFDFTTEASANSATAALLSQVFIGIFDDDPNLTFGCSDTIACIVVLPFGLAENSLILSSWAINYYSLGEDWNAGPALITNFDSGGEFGGNSVFVRFTPSVVAAVPEPSTWTMILLGFGGIGFAMRRRRKQNIFAVSA